MRDEFYFPSKDGNTEIHTIEWKPEGEVKWDIDRQTGALRSYMYNGKEMLASPVVLSLYRPVTDNDNRDTMNLQNSCVVMDIMSLETII